MHRLLTVLPLLVIAPLRPGAAQAASHDGIDAVYRDFIAGYAQLDPGLVASRYADDAIYLSAGSPVQVGRPAIEAIFVGFLGDMRERGDSLRLQFRIVERRVVGDAAFDVGYFHLVRVHGDSAGAPGVGRFVTALRREPDGKWRFVVDSYDASDLTAWNGARKGVEP